MSGEVLDHLLRLRVMAVLSQVEEMPWSSLKDGLDVKDYELSRSLQLLEAAGFLVITRGSSDRRRKVVRCTAKGHAAYQERTRQLLQILGRHEV